MNYWARAQLVSASHQTGKKEIALPSHVATSWSRECIDLQQRCQPAKVEGIIRDVPRTNIRDLSWSAQFAIREILADASMPKEMT